MARRYSDTYYLSRAIGEAQRALEGLRKMAAPPDQAIRELELAISSMVDRLTRVGG